jgi:hypothetical protein
MTEARKAALVVAETQKEGAAIDALYAKELALAGLTQTKIAEIQNKQREENDKVAEAIYEAQAKAAEKTQQVWETGEKSVNSAIEGQINGLLAGTESWGTAGKKVITDLLEQLIKLGVERTLVFGENSIGGALGIAGASSSGAGAAGLALTTANTTALTANTAATAVSATSTSANTATQSTGVAAWVSNTVATLANTVATDLSNIGHLFGFAEGTPMVKQSGLAVIHAGEAIVPKAMDPFAGLSSFDFGAWDIPRDQLSFVHQNELVMPAAEAGAFRGMLRGGGGGGAGGAPVTIAPQVAFHTSAIDGANVASFFRNNQRGMMKAIDEAVRHGAHLGLRGLQRS